MKTDLDITHLYKTEEEWTNDFELLKNNIKELKQKENFLLENIDTFKSFIKLRLDSEALTDKLYSYCKRQIDIDFSKEELKTKLNEVLTIYSELQIIGTNLEKNISNNSELIKEYLTNQKLSKYNRTINEIIRKKEHIIDDEKNISKYMKTQQKIKNEYQDILINRCKSTTIEINDNSIEINKDNINTLLKDQNETNRKLYSEAYINTYSKFDKEVATLLKEKLTLDIELSKNKKFNTLLEEKMFTYDLPTTIFDNLINRINENIQIKHDFNKLRKKILNLEEFHSYDINLPICEISKLKIKLEEGIDKIKKSLNILGKEYTNLIDKMFEEGWIDVYPKDKKINRSYTSIIYSGVPYVITNYTDNILSLRNLTHEIGHASNTYFSKLKNNNHDFSVSFFLTEVASKVNEILLDDYMLKTITNLDEKKFILYNNINSLINSIFNQTMLSEFENTIIKKLENNENVTHEYINNLYLELNNRYNGKYLINAENTKYNWIKINHFILQDSYYVYQYSIGACLALYIVNKLYTDETMKDKYLEFLSLGESISIEDCLYKLGINLNEDDYIGFGLKYLKNKIKEFSDLY